MYSKYIGKSRYFIRIEDKELHGFTTKKGLKAWLKASRLVFPNYDYGTLLDGILEHSVTPKQLRSIKLHK